MEQNQERYELVYGTGGHGGPHIGLENAKRRAHEMLDGDPSEFNVHVVPYSAPRYHFMYAVYTASRRK